MFLRNAWYVADWANTINRDLRGIMVLGEKIVAYRTQAGKPVALQDACPHRKLPLSMGRLRGDEIECGYHGLTFDCSGACTRVYGQDRIPPTARVHSYPVADKWGLTWIWLGDPDQADADNIFHVEHFDDPAWGINSGDSMMLDCNYLYITDNLLDPTHVAWVHPTSFGNAACENTPLQIDVSDDGVTVSRWMMDVEMAPFYKSLVRFEGNTDRKQHYEVRYPAHAIIRAIFAPAGQGGDNLALSDDCFIMESYNFMTPVDENRTRYFWFQLRNVLPDCAETSAMMASGVDTAFAEDRAILNAVHKGMAEVTDGNLDLAIDAGALRFRRELQKRIDAEIEAAALPRT